ncbi:MAG TPA: cytochrome c oxidase subunit II [Terracidiphilus sp.]|nr:cytochrome c oxidase subunit II [Terracidiphilus sp.]
MPRRAALILFCLVFTVAGVGARMAPSSNAPRRIEITAHRFAYEPDAITLKKGETVLLVLKTLDVNHGLRVRELGLDLKTSKGKPAEELFAPRKTGDFIGHCSVFCGAKHGTMKITFHVVE